MSMKEVGPTGLNPEQPNSVLSAGEIVKILQNSFVIDRFKIRGDVSTLIMPDGKFDFNRLRDIADDTLSFPLQIVSGINIGGLKPNEHEEQIINLLRVVIQQLHFDETADVNEAATKNGPQSVTIHDAPVDPAKGEHWSNRNRKKSKGRPRGPGSCLRNLINKGASIPLTRYGKKRFRIT
jgi:hypothetical protein